jgi:hypothetical protein
LAVSFLLGALWVRSYWCFDWLGGLTLTAGNNGFSVKDGCLIESANGALVVLYAGNIQESVLRMGTLAGSSTPNSDLRVTGNNGESAWNGFQASVYPNGVFRGSVPHWAPALAFGALAAALGIRAPHRFSLRTLLFVTTLVAVVLGAVVIAGR